jgi:hypothetical protein
VYHITYIQHLIFIYDSHDPRSPFDYSTQRRWSRQESTALVHIPTYFLHDIDTNLSRYTIMLSLLFYSSVAFKLGTMITDGLSCLLFVCTHEIWNNVDLRLFICVHAFHCCKTHGGFSLTIAFPCLWRIALASMEFGVDFNDHSCALFQDGVPAINDIDTCLWRTFWLNEDGRISITAGQLTCFRSSDVPTIMASDAYR